MSLRGAFLVVGAFLSNGFMAWASPHQASARSNILSRAGQNGTQYRTPATEKYLVDGANIPNVAFDVGENYAGTIPLQTGNSSSNGTTAPAQQEMFFWFFPTTNPAGKDDIVIWLNGGPGCSSLEGFMEESGPFNWKPGTFRPIANAWSFHKLANVIWIKQPINTGLSNGPVIAADNDQTAAQFLQFFENFNSIFNLTNKNVYITGESYGGVYIPFIGAAMLARNDTANFNLKGTLWYNGVLPGFYTQDASEAVIPAFLRYWGNLLAIDPSTRAEIEQRAETCGHNEYLDKYITYPPPTAPFPAFKVNYTTCSVSALYIDAMYLANPCYNAYHVSDQCPLLWDVLGGQSAYEPAGASIYFNDPAVRRAIHAPAAVKTWEECSGPVFSTGEFGNYSNTKHAARVQSVIEGTNNVIIGSGLLDTVVGANVTVIALQQQQWNGKQGFQTAPSQSFVLPTNGVSDYANHAGLGFAGTTQTERGLTYVTINLAGHEVPQYQPAAAFRHLEVLLGRVANLTSAEPWSVNISTNFEYPY